LGPVPCGTPAGFAWKNDAHGVFALCFGWLCRHDSEFKSTEVHALDCKSQGPVGAAPFCVSRSRLCFRMAILVPEIYMDMSLAVHFIIIGGTSRPLLFPIMGIIGYIWDVRRFSLACRELFWGEVPNDYGRWRDQFTAILICDLRGVDGCASQTLIRESVTCWSKYDATWFEATGGSIHDWTAYFGFSFWGGAVIPILCTMAFRLYVGDGVWGSVFETWKDRNLARYLHALDAKIHKEGLVAAKMLLHTHWTVFHRIAIWSETFNLLS